MTYKKNRALTFVATLLGRFLLYKSSSPFCHRSFQQLTNNNTLSWEELYEHYLPEINTDSDNIIDLAKENPEDDNSNNN
ncbi:4348_t:CDS:2, partial [Racocetra persica]